jgi:hypothetical protein
LAEGLCNPHGSGRGKRLEPLQKVLRWNMEVLISLLVDCLVSILTLAVFGEFCNCSDQGCVSHELSCDSPLLDASHGLEDQLCKGESDQQHYPVAATPIL